MAYDRPFTLEDALRYFNTRGKNFPCSFCGESNFGILRDVPDGQLEMLRVTTPDRQAGINVINCTCLNCGMIYQFSAYLLDKWLMENPPETDDNG